MPARSLPDSMVWKWRKRVDRAAACGRNPRLMPKLSNCDSIRIAVIAIWLA